MTRPDPNEPYWGIEEVAAYLNVGPSTVTAYRKRGQMPPHDRKYGRSYVWMPATIMAWRPPAPEPPLEPPLEPPVTVNRVDVPDWKLIDSRLSKLDCHLKTPSFVAPLSFGTPAIRPSVTPLGQGGVLFSVDYDFEITDSRTSTIAELNVTLVGVYDGLPDEEPDMATFNLFGRRKVLPLFHNLIREQLHDLTMRMGLPPLAIELFRWTGDEVVAQPSPSSG